MTCVGAAIPQSSGERGGGGGGGGRGCVPKIRKSLRNARKRGGGGFRNVVSPEILAFKGREQAYMRTLNNTEWGGGGGGNAALH